MRAFSVRAVIALIYLVPIPLAPAQKPEKPPHGQDKMPGPALSPQEAIKKMTVPPGFTVELVASEPDLINPVAMTFDERGRIWIAESVEYPRSSAGKGKDRIKILEDTDGDGKIDKITVFAEGLNIPSGIAVGHGGVWVANAPDILFMQDTDGDGKAEKVEVVATGFGRADTHELPNSLTWGPDGWLYGLNGVFNPSVVSSKGKELRFTCALWRIHPRTREFQLFCEGTSNPWGVAYDTEGSTFISACVIDHLWHLTETGYYHRQGGAYPPFTWKLGSIVKHKNQKAAYCGIHYFDSDSYPVEYRQKLYMGNIHGGCINVDVLRRDGSTYFATPGPDFLTANDPWFMPVAQKTGPDGCLYILDWYDRYHCYQDARRDPQGIDRANGRLYRIRYKDTPRAPKLDLARETDDQLIQRLHSSNVYFRDIAQRLLDERGTPSVRAKLQQLVLDEAAPRTARMHGLWSLIGMGPLDPVFQHKLLDHQDSGYRAWAVRAAGNAGKIPGAVRDKIRTLAGDRSPDVQLQVAIAARKIEGLDVLDTLLAVLSACGEDKLIPVIVWQNLHPLLEERAGELLARVEKLELSKSPNLALLMPRIVERILARRQNDAGIAVALLGMLVTGKNADLESARRCLAVLASRSQTGELVGTELAELRQKIQPLLARLKGSSLAHDASLLAVIFGDPDARQEARQLLFAATQSEALRHRALEALVAVKEESILDGLPALLTAGKGNSLAFRGQVLAAVGRLEQPRLASVVLQCYPGLEAELQPRAIELLTQRTSWSKELLQAVAAKKIPKSVLSVNHVRKIQTSKDADLLKLVRDQWGTLREDRNPEREKIVEQMRTVLRREKGDALAGVQVFKRVCAQCHKLHGEGQEVGPDITVNGRSTFDQLLSNVFDPSLVIGTSYQATTILTVKGRVLTGLLVEDSPERVVLKVQGGKLETIPRANIDDISLSKVSLMPEGVEKEMKAQEVADLFAYLCLDKPPGDSSARKIPGAP